MFKKKTLTKLEDCASKRSLGMLDSSQNYQMLNKIKINDNGCADKTKASRLDVCLVHKLTAINRIKNS